MLDREDLLASGTYEPEMMDDGWYLMLSNLIAPNKTNPGGFFAGAC